MSATTVNAFPPLHAFNSSRSWTLATIVLVHLGFFWGLTHGVSVYSFKPETGGTVVLIPSDPPHRRRRGRSKPVEPGVNNVWVPTRSSSRCCRPTSSRRASPVTQEPQPATAAHDGDRRPGLRTAHPRAGGRRALSVHRARISGLGNPSGARRHGVAVGADPAERPRRAVRIDKSSGYPKLDESAAREARQWRMKPGTSDGVGDGDVEAGADQVPAEELSRGDGQLAGEAISPASWPVHQRYVNDAP